MLIANYSHIPEEKKDERDGNVVDALDIKTG
jgi:hypothetical protein